jgi:hypothetical protein
MFDALMPLHLVLFVVKKQKIKRSKVQKPPQTFSSSFSFSPTPPSFLLFFFSSPAR